MEVMLKTPEARLLADTEKENPVYSLMLKVGTEVQLRLGYSNAPDNLETVINGKLTSVNLAMLMIVLRLSFKAMQWNLSRM
jgi:hypothetical protein